MNTLAPLSGALAPSHPRPQLQRPGSPWTDLSGHWDFSHDDDDRGIADGWYTAGTAADAAFDRQIVVPYPPESTASGIADTGVHPIVWYRRVLPVQRRNGRRALVHFGAVDYRADVWLDGQYLGSHEGGSTPFWFDVTDLLAEGPSSPVLVVRAHDATRDVAQPRGKQDWQDDPHGIWYERTTGIWQPVWIEEVPELFIEHLSWTPDLTSGSVELAVELNRDPSPETTVGVVLHLGGEVLERVTFAPGARTATHSIRIDRYRNGPEQGSLQWSPENPCLIEAIVTVTGAGAGDEVASYFGMRSASVANGHFLLNDRPYYVRSVLEQGFWPESHLAAPSDDALRGEVELIKALGFNAARIHQKVEDPRFLYWADRLGLLIWGENASAYEFSPTAIERMTTEWISVIKRDRSHPCIVTWVPLNESWGVPQISLDPAQLSYAQGLYHLTKALDPTRPVVSNDGWEHADSDIWTVHDYGTTHAEVAASYANAETALELMDSIGPVGRRMRLLDVADRGQPLMVTEFGGVGYVNPGDDKAWGYSTAQTPEEFEALLRALFSAIQLSPVVAGFCYTQFSDTRQEANGLVDADRRPKLPVATIRSIVIGDRVDTTWQRRPRRPDHDLIDPDLVDTE
ncbi:glycoside hydrolase family 2 protein [Salinibacterium soli]|uniref:Glycoside hydrolase family 2 TIM barrel-domain containing protein n=1 Tax=Antiquaquibacter soli TaxID=3064523 RepID=A0ABT9BQ60_9MICO|nr:glycoside hydrolase family 2 TIM barrel-domain containing protein [Protaetiibacter sp. WY-16]MDO7883079.1 glycoside hydrolase family 2 TIM barrel-domain containing protein [Protaetiibacter sp. WY-16]